MSEAADILHVRKKPEWKTVQNYLNDGSLPCIRVGQSGHIKPGDGEAFYSIFTA